MRPSSLQLLLAVFLLPLALSGCCSALTACSTAPPKDRTCEPIRSGSPCAQSTFNDRSLAKLALQRVDFTEAQLQRVDFTEAHLDRAVLLSADLSGAKLVKVRAPRADFSGANLSNTTLRRAVFSQVSFKGANLSKADAQFADFSGADLTGANINGVDWRGATCPDTTYSLDHGGTCEGHLDGSGVDKTGSQKSNQKTEKVKPVEPYNPLTGPQ